jgi:hypothetical protein
MVDEAALERNCPNPFGFVHQSQRNTAAERIIGAVSTGQFLILANVTLASLIQSSYAI